MLKQNFKFHFFLLFLFKVFLGVFLSSCNAKKDQTNIELIQNMMDQVSIKFQGEDQKQDKLLVQRVPPEGSIPRHYDVYPYKGDPITAGKKLKNPLKLNSSSSDLSQSRLASDLILLGQGHYENFCALCHGLSGRGDGQIAPFMLLKPPSLHSEKVKGFTDGRIFHIITDGQGVMGSHLLQIPKARDRWAVVNYIRKLQGLNTKKASLKKK